MADTTAVRAAIVRAAQEHGIDPAYALAIAERESSFNPGAKASKTIRGVYQMSRELRAKYGSGDSADPYEQAQGWMRSVPDLKRDMGKRLGRDVTDQEAYLGHHFGPGRAARMMKMDPATPVASVFTPQEMAGNPHFARAGTVGNLNGSVMGDVEKRMARFGGENAPASVEPADLSMFGKPVLEAGESGDTGASAPASLPVGAPPTRTAAAAPALPPDLSMYGKPVEALS